jgi:hypothetical protein
MVHVLGIGVRVIQPPGVEKGDGKAPDEKPRGKRGKRPVESKPPEPKPDAKPESGKDKPAGDKKDGEAKP